MTENELSMFTLNVNGLSDDKKFQRVAACLGQTLSTNERIKERYDIVFLQEHFLQGNLMEKRSQEWKEWGGSAAFFAPGYVTDRGVCRGGVAILLGNKPIFDFEQNLKPKVIIPGRAMSIQVKIHNIDFLIVVVYAPNGKNERREFFEKLDFLVPKDIPVIWGGDFNCVENPALDRSPARTFFESGVPQIKSFNASRGLVDPFRFNKPNKKLFTYTHSGQNGVSVHRIDRIYAPKCFAANAKCKVSPFLDCDHNAFQVTIYLNEGLVPKDKGPGLFRMNTRLLKHEEYKEEAIQLATESRADSNPTKRGRWENHKTRVRLHSKQWAKEIVRRDKVEYKAALKAYDDEQMKDEPDTATLQSLSARLLDEERKEVDKLLIQTQTDRLEMDEKPTAYFYNTLRTRHKNSTIDEVFTSSDPTIDRSTTKNPGKIMKKIFDFYENLYAEHEDEISETEMNRLLENNLKKLPDAVAASLERPLTLDDLKQAVKTMKNNKAPGEDGIPMEYYKEFGDEVLPMLLEAALEGYSETKMSEMQRNAIITLLYKKGDRENLANWRPVSLLCCDYKIIAKALALRLIPVLEYIIHEDQTCGVAGRTISNNTWLLRDIIDRATEQQDLSILFSLDLEKAFDRVNHKFMFKSLESFGFGPRFIQWIKTLYGGCRSFVKNDGNLTKGIDIERGIRQGCPISIFLFVITAELIAMAIRADPNMIGILVPSLDNKCVKLSQYADDTGALINAKLDASMQRSVEAFYRIVELYEKASGAKLNFSKCKALVFGGGSPRANQYHANRFNELRRITNAQKQKPDDQIQFTGIDSPSEDGVKILGIWFHPDLKECIRRNMDPLLKKVEDGLRWAKMRSLSIKGKVIVVNTFILSKLWYVATTIPLTTSQGVELHEKKYISKINELISKYIWNAKNPFVKLEVMAKPKEKGGLGLQIIWKKALSLRGRQLNHILDFSNVSPSALLSRFLIARKIKDIIPWVTNALRVYNTPDRRIIPDPRSTPPPTIRGYRYLGDFFYQMKECFQPRNQTPPQPNKLPTSKKLYLKKLDNTEQPNSTEKWARHGITTIPWENSFNTWNTVRDAAVTFRLRHCALIRETRNQPNCTICQSHPDTHHHIFASCVFARNVWRKMETPIRHLNNGAVPPYTYIGVSGTGRNERLLNTIINCTNAAIWHTRNQKKHENISISFDGTAKLAIHKFKEAIKLHWKIAQRNNRTDEFKNKIITPQVATISDDSLTFNIPVI